MKAEDLTISDKLSILETALQLYKSGTLHSRSTTPSYYAGLYAAGNTDWPQELLYRYCQAF